MRAIEYIGLVIAAALIIIIPVFAGVIAAVFLLIGVPALIFYEKKAEKKDKEAVA